MRRLVFINQKGGVGKTTSAINIAAALTRLKRRVLLIEANDSANVTFVLGRGEPRHTLYDVLMGEVPPAEAIIPTAEEGLFLLPSDATFSNFATRAREVNEAVPQLVMREQLKTITDFDFVILDAPPTLDLAAVNALAYADEAWIPVEPSLTSVQGLDRLMGMIEALRTNFPQTRIAPAGIFLNLADHRTLAVPQVLDHLRRHYPTLLCETIISKSARLNYATASRQSVFAYDPFSRAANQYLDLTHEVVAYAQQPARVG